jgi:phage shock protein A
MRKKIKKVTLGSLENSVSGLSTTVSSLSTTVEKLASAMEAGFKRVESKMDKGFRETKEDNESLARMVANGFEHTGKEISGLQISFTRLEQNQENMQLRLDYLAPQFEVKELTRRVKRLEDKVGIRNPGRH